MKIKTLVAALLLSGGAAGAYAQNDCNANSSISHEAVKAGNFKDAYAPCMEVLKDCPTLRFYTYGDAKDILQSFLKGIKDRNSADYQKYFNELMSVYDQEMKYIPEFLAKGTKLNYGVEGAKGRKAIDYLTYAPKPDLNQAYAWLKESVDADKQEANPTILFYFMNTSMQKVKADAAHTEQFFQDYLDATKYTDAAIAAETKPSTKNTLEKIKESIVAIFINSGVADCESLQKIYGPQVEANQTDTVFLKKAINVLKMMKCTESDAYFQASYYMYKINPTADAAVGCGFQAYKKGDYDTAVKYFDEALGLETDNAKKAEMAYAAAAAMFGAKKWSQVRSYCYKAIGFNENFGNAYILLAQAYGSNPHWNDEPALNKCTYYVVLDKLQRAKSVDPSVAEQANKLIGTYSAHLPEAKDLFMLGYKTGDRITVEGWIGETTTIR